MEETNNEYVVTLYEACELLNKSARTVSRYVRKGFLTPMSIRSRKGTLEYRFSRAELDSLKDREDEIRQATFAEDETSEPVSAQFASIDLAQERPAVEMPFVIQSEAPTPDTSDMTGQTRLQATPEAETKKQTEPVIGDNPAATVEEQQSNSVAIPSADKEIIDLLKETTGMLRDQLQVKDEQIKSLNDKIDNLIERDRETNILLKGLQDKFLYLDKPKNEQSRTVSEKAETVQAADEPAKIVKGPEEKNKTKNKINNGKNNKERQDTPEKLNKQKKNNQDKPKKGFWGGLFGK
jgi:hypothetical protein